MLFQRFTGPVPGVEADAVVGVAGRIALLPVVWLSDSTVVSVAGGVLSTMRSPVLLCWRFSAPLSLDELVISFPKFSCFARKASSVSFFTNSTEASPSWMSLHSALSTEPFKG